MTLSENSAWSDSPRSKTDIGGRPAFAAAVADRINATRKGSSSTVYGLVGPWGSGKTTLLRDIESQLNGRTVWFSPWSAADVAAITGEFVAALSEAFPKAKKLRSRLLGYARFGIPALKMVPYAGEAASDIADKFFKKFAPSPTWHTEFEAISKEIAEQGEQVLVIVDDVDRLDANELRALLRVIRLLGRFNDVHYLIAYDQATIDQLLANSGMAGQSSDFMEKIVQYPFEIPPTPAIERRRWARELVTIAVPVQAQLSDDLRIPTENLIRILAAGIETPRAAERLREQLSSFVNLAAKAELDGLDFVTISWLRIAHHNVWDHVRSRGEIFQAWSDTDDDKSRSEQWDEISNLVERGTVKPVWDAVRFLFDSSSEFLAPAGRKQGIRSPRYFDRYFLLGLADDDVSDAKTQAAVDQLVADTKTSPEIELLSELILSADGERAALALQVGRDSRKGDDASIALVDYLSARRLELESADRLHDFRQSPLERWLAREIALVLASGDLATEDAVERFGYELLISCAYGLRRIGGRDDDLVRAAFSGVADDWIKTIGNEGLEEILARPELRVMLRFCKWLETDTGARVLERSISSAGDLLRVGQKFVAYTALIGNSVEYDVEFDEGAFRLAVGAALSKQNQANLPAPDDSLHYEIADRPTRELATNELRDFTIRKLRGLVP